MCRVSSFFGTIRPYKGLDLLIEAAINLWKDGHNFELAIAGKPFMPVEALFGRIRGAGFAHRLITDLGFLPKAASTRIFRAAPISLPFLIARSIRAVPSCPRSAMAPPW